MALEKGIEQMTAQAEELLKGALECMWTAQLGPRAWGQGRQVKLGRKLPLVAVSKGFLLEVKRALPSSWWGLGPREAEACGCGSVGPGC